MVWDKIEKADFTELFCESITFHENTFVIK